MKDKEPKKIISAEDFSEEVEALLRYAEERARAGRQPQSPGRGAAPVRTLLPDKPDITDLLRNKIVSALEDEVVLATEAGPERGILDWELQREVAKKALVGLKLHKLKELAAEMRLDKRGRSEEIADRIARAYRYDEQQIARLILDNEEEPEPDRGHVDRIFPLAEAPNIESVEMRLEPVMGRYVRVGVARWFVFEELRRAGIRLTLRGALRTYRTFVTSEETEVEGEAPAEVAHLSASPSEVSVELELVDGLRALRVRSAAPAPARAASKALEVATECRRLGHLPFASASFEGPLGAFARSTIFMLDFVDERLANAGVQDRNLTVARFEIEKGDGSASTAEGERPTLREVRFEGDHLLDSVPACRLIATEGRALVDLSMRVSIRSTDGELVRFPIRLGLERDHAVVLTGFGRYGPEASLQLHHDLVRAVESGFDDGVASRSRLESLAGRIDELARSGREVEKATMLGDKGEEAATDEDDDEG